ncbi:ribonuclease Z [candidate division KSB1 bacterium]|nr:ribonuclease Z [candidate division KSB1 bacterium]
MDCILLGTGGMMPMPYRWLTSLMVRLNGSIYQFDAGEGVQIMLKQAQWGIKALRMLAITHLHADHCLGLPGLLMFRAQNEAPPPLTLIGPPGLGHFVQTVRDSLDFYINYPLSFIEWSPTAGALAYQDENVKLFWAPLQHSIFCLGYRLEEHPRPGKFHAARASALNIPVGPLWGKLQHGEMIQLSSQETITPAQVLGPPRRGRHLSFIVDTRPTPAIGELCRATDITFIEGMFGDELQAEAIAKGHLTCREAAALTHTAGVDRTILVHFSPRYRTADLAQLLAEAESQHPAVEIGRALQPYAIPLPADPK